MIMSSFAVFVIIVVIVAGLWGWRAGLLKQVGQIAGVILGIALSRTFGAACISLLCSADSSPADRMLYTVLAYILIFLAAYSATMFVAYLMRSLLQAIHLGTLNALAGAVFRITEWIFFLSIILNLWESVSPVASLADDPVYTRVLWFGPWLLGSDFTEQIGAAAGSLTL